MTTREAPSLVELRRRVFKHSARSPHVGLGSGAPTPAPPEIGNWLARRVGRPSAVYGTWLAVRLGLSAHAITGLAVAATAIGAAGIATGTRAGFVAGGVLLALAYWLDHVDGQVARWRRTASLDGVYFDYLLHHFAALVTGFALGHGLAVRGGTPGWSVAGLLIGGGWLFLGLQNDCRYKAFFQRLKRESIGFRVEGGAGGKPAPPAPWPRRGTGRLTWPAYKLCEPHLVLPAILLLSALAVLAPSAWERAWMGYAAGMALAAPVLATARVARAIAGGATGREFDRWFRPDA